MFLEGVPWPNPSRVRLKPLRPLSAHLGCVWGIQGIRSRRGGRVRTLETQASTSQVSGITTTRWRTNRADPQGSVWKPEHYGPIPGRMSLGLRSLTGPSRGQSSSQHRRTPVSTWALDPSKVRLGIVERRPRVDYTEPIRPWGQSETFTAGSQPEMYSSSFCPTGSVWKPAQDEQALRAGTASDPHRVRLSRIDGDLSRT